ncbi:hypothetical protein [Sulfurimonas indica]|uniref:hypothetical protein n=1 Tax=Sulfurimonas indica TaxID=2508707 RepID=UPI001264BC24|nr:hypothetical protein [Sulfurimonas indica]
MMRMVKYVFFLIVVLFISGCTTHQGNAQIPLTPISYISDEDNNMSTIMYYRAVDFSGALRFGNYTCFIDFDFHHDDKYEVQDIIMYADRNQYTVKKVTPGVHKFSLVNLFNGELSSITANIESNKTYFLAVTYNPFNPIPTLQFRTKKDFEDNAKDDKQVIVDGKCFPKLDGCHFKEVTSK